MKKAARALALLALSSMAFGAASQPAYPAKPVTIVVPYAPGGLSDSLARALAQRLAVGLKQPVVVDNKPGANTLIGAGAVAKAPADGHTLLLTAEATLAINPHLYAKLPYHPESSFAPVAALASLSQGLAVSPGMPADSLSKFLAQAKSARLTYANLGAGSTAHLNMELFQRAAGVKLEGVPYKGAGPALTDLMGGHVDAMIVATGLVAPQVQAGKLKLLAVGGSRRSALVPGVPTFAEAGLPDYQPSSWFALLAVAGTSPEIVRRLNADVNRILADPAFKTEFLDRNGLEAIGGSAEQLGALVRTEARRWGEVVRAAQVKVE